MGFTYLGGVITQTDTDKMTVPELGERVVQIDNLVKSVTETLKENEMKISISKEREDKENQTIVRVVTTAWHNNKGLHTKRSLNLLKRKSFGFDILQEECIQLGAEDAAKNISNLHKVADGTYELIACNISRDYESGYIDDWNLMLIPYKATEE